MLILKHAKEIPYNIVLNYYNTYDKTSRNKELTSFSLLNAKNENEYNTCINVFEKNLYYLIDTNQENIIIGHGVLNIRSSSQDSPKDYAEVAYGINPFFRMNGYGTVLLSMLIEKAKELNLNKLYISCNETNLGSKKIIESNNAKFETKFDDIDGIPSLEYSIRLKDKSLKKIKRH